ncbi:hypothetical protein [Pedobacter nutrimenti]|uniref:Uncharacterized protein n=1 Tax=Pedobacter nutrimenti TaxID=1241337 RepID=A0A318UKS6_9SPHI|nr:hypothetical protein [Pedobacter nutrimenti]PYF77046.1 hypothetical protein B0O44_101524 [Pedobacter nutrimenti]
MSKREIKCPHCAEWVKWEGELYERCIKCNNLLEQEKIDKIKALDALKKAKEEMERARIARQNPFLRKVEDYATSIFIGLIMLIISVVVLAAG